MQARQLARGGGRYSGRFTLPPVWPVENGLKRESKTFPFVLKGDQTTHRFIWTRRQVQFQSLQGHREDDQEEFSSWVYRPQDVSRYLAQQAMPVHLNLWLFKGLPPKNRREVEVVLRSFRFTPE